MSTSTTKRDINLAITDAMVAAFISSEYNRVKNPTIFLEHTVNNFIYNSNIEDLWGPKWSLFLSIIVDNIDPELSLDIKISAVVDVLGRMTGGLKVDPIEIIAKKNNIPIDDTVRSMLHYGSKHQIYIAEQACKALNIPSPIGVSPTCGGGGDKKCSSCAHQPFKQSPGCCKSVTKDDKRSIPIKLKRKENEL